MQENNENQSKNNSYKQFPSIDLRRTATIYSYNNYEQQCQETSNVDLKKNQDQLKQEKIIETVINQDQTKIVQSLQFQILVTIIACISLFINDIRIIFFTNNQDFAIDIFNICLMGFFILEIIMNLSVQGYLGSFYFFLDLFSTLFMIFDLSMISTILFSPNSSSLQFNDFASKSRASRAAARAVRIMKIFRLARLAKLYQSSQKARILSKRKSDKQILFKLFKQQAQSKINECGNDLYYKPQNNDIKKKIFNFFTQNKQNEKNEQQNSQVQFNNKKETLSKNGSESEQYNYNVKNKQDQKQNKQSNISKILSQSTMKKTIIIILIIMTLLPIMDYNNYISQPTSWDLLVQLIYNLLLSPQFPVQMIQDTIKTNYNNFPSNHVYSEIICIQTPFNNLGICNSFDLDNYRIADIGYFIKEINNELIINIRPQIKLNVSRNIQFSNSSIVVIINYRKYNQIDAAFSIAITLFVCFTIIYLLGSFSISINQLIINPIQKMLSTLKSKQIQQVQTDNSSKDQNQTQLVQRSIIKLKSLLSTIFSTPGSQLVHQTILHSNAAIMNLDQSIRSRLAINIYCKIKNIKKITQILGQDTIKFMNELFAIVNGASYRYGGYCTKINHEGFILTFFIPQKIISSYEIQEDSELKNLQQNRTHENNNYIKVISDYSLYSILKILARLSTQQ